MRKVLWAGLATLCASIVGACGDSSENTAEPGTENGPCPSSGACNAGLVCASHTCVRFPGGPDASGTGGAGGGTGGQVSAGNASGSGASAGAAQSTGARATTDGGGASGGQGGQRTTDGGGASNGGASGGQGGKPPTTGGNGKDGSAGSTPCDAATRMPLDLFLLVDTSGSMAQGTQWQDVSSALVAFLNDPVNAGIDVAIEYFPLMVPGVPAVCCEDADCGTYGPCVSSLPPLSGCSHPFGNCASADSCNATFYTPAVPFALPVDHAPVVTSLEAQAPGGGTPTRPALEAAVKYVETWTPSHSGRHAVIVLITDGDPTGCTTNSAQDVANVAADGLKNGIETFVVGFGSSLTNLNLVAAAGGTAQAYLADAGDAGGLVSDALAKVRAAALASGCAP